MICFARAGDADTHPVLNSDWWPRDEPRFARDHPDGELENATGPDGDLPAGQTSLAFARSRPNWIYVPTAVEMTDDWGLLHADSMTAAEQKTMADYVTAPSLTF